MADTQSPEQKQGPSIELGIERATELAYTVMVRRSNPAPDWSVCSWQVQPEALREDWRACIRAILEFQPERAFKGEARIADVAALQVREQKQDPIAEVLARAMWPPIESGRIASVAPRWAEEIVERLAAAGYVIVPLEPSAEMCAVGFAIEEARYAAHHPQEDRCAAEVWRAMVEASR